MERVRVCVLATALVAAAAQPARANCCNDFWSCAAAVATGGLSCAVTAAIEALDGLKRRAENGKRGAEQERDRLTQVMRGDAQQRANDSEAASNARARAIAAQASSVKDSHDRAFRLAPASAARLQATQTRIAAPAAAALVPARVAPAQVAPARVTVAAPQPAVNQPQANQPAADSDVQRASDDTLAKLRALQVEATTDHAKLKREQIADLQRAARTAVDGMRVAFQASLIAPLVGFVASMPPPDPALTAAIIATVATQLDRIEREGNAAVARKLAESERAIKTEAEKLHAKLAEQAQREDQARHLADLHARMLQSRAQRDLDALRAALGQPPSQPPSQAAGQAADAARNRAPVATRPTAAATAAMPLPAFALQPIGGAAPSAARLAVQPAPLEAATLEQFRERSQAELRERLTAKDDKGIAKKKALLIAEARRRFAKDPTTRDKVIAYIDATPVK